MAEYAGRAAKPALHPVTSVTAPIRSEIEAKTEKTSAD